MERLIQEEYPIVPNAHDIMEGGVQHQLDARMVQHFPEKLRIAALRHPLEPIVEISRVPADKHGNTGSNCAIDFLRLHAPLLFRIVQKDFLVYEIRQILQILVFRLLQLQDGDLRVVGITFQQSRFHALRHGFRENLMQGV